MADLRTTFENPDARWRGKPFWAWNAKLEEEELRRQIRVMNTMGLGGFFMHSRVGLDTPYLSEEWFALVNACIDEARRLDMEAWLYDEDRWPSGAAGGLVTKEHAYRKRSLYMVVCDAAEARFTEEPFALFAAKVNGPDVTEARRLEPGTEMPADGQVVAFFVIVDGDSPWFNGQAYLDTMNHEAVKRFIEVTHEAYREHCGDEFGRLVPGIFTDEPNYGRAYNTSAALAARLLGTEERKDVVAHGVPWTGAIPRVFRERYGYDLMDRLPEVFLRADGAVISRLRRDYFDCITHLFVDAFARQIGEWCEENDIMHTGHVLSESALRGQACVVGACMRFYEHMQAPGIDILTERNHEFSTAKQCQSVLHQSGRKWMLSELYGCTGWDFPFEGHKAVGDWQAALGVNLRCQHLSWYSMFGQAKRDYPASIFFHSPWWQQYSAVEDYFSRVNAVMSAGEPVQRLLVVHPIESAWARGGVAWWDDPVGEEREQQFAGIIDMLLDGHVDFHFGDEEIMGRIGSVDGEMLRVGECTYDVALVPPADTLRASTVALLAAFSAAGGRVVFCEPVPTCVDAEEATAAAELAARCVKVPFEKEAVLDAVEPARVLNITGPDEQEVESVIYQFRRDSTESYLFICNRDRDNGTGPMNVCVQTDAPVQMWDAETGRRYSVDWEASGHCMSFAAELPPSGSALYAFTMAEENLPAVPQWTEARAIELSDSAWTPERNEPNVLVLDVCEWKVNDGDWQGPHEILKADLEIRDLLDLPRRGGQMVQPWAQDKAAEPAGRITLRYRFQVERAPRDALKLAMENPGRFEVTLNGDAVPTNSPSGWWVDPSILLVPIDAPLKRGENELVMTARMDADTALEICYLLGEFSVELDEECVPHMTDTVPNPNIGNWVEQGMPFYSGNVTWRATVMPHVEAGERVFVEVPEFKGTCVRVLVDGHEAGIIGWQPHEVDVTDLVQDRPEVELAIEVCSHRRNSFGPLHNSEYPMRWTGPGQFMGHGTDEWMESYMLVPCGLMAAPRLSVRTAL